MRRQYPQLSILNPHASLGGLEVEVVVRLSGKTLRLGRSCLRLVVTYQPSAPSLN